MAQGIPVNTRTARRMAKESLLLLTVPATKEPSQTTTCTAKALTFGLMVANMLDSGSWRKCMVVAPSPGPMAESMRVTTRTTTNMVVEDSLAPTSESGKAHGLRTSRLTRAGTSQTQKLQQRVHGTYRTNRLVLLLLILMSLLLPPHLLDTCRILCLVEKGMG